LIKSNQQGCTNAAAAVNKGHAILSEIGNSNEFLFSAKTAIRIRESAEDFLGRNVSKQAL